MPWRAVVLGAGWGGVKAVVWERRAVRRTVESFMVGDKLGDRCAIERKVMAG
jgi:hypothetical protein